MMYAEAAHKVAESAERAFREADKEAIRNFLEGPVQEAIIKRMGQGMFSTVIEYNIMVQNSKYNMQFLPISEVKEYINNYMKQYGFTICSNIIHSNILLLRISW